MDGTLWGVAPNKQDLLYSLGNGVFVEVFVSGTSGRKYRVIFKVLSLGRQIKNISPHNEVFEFTGQTEANIGVAGKVYYGTAANQIAIVMGSE